MQFCVNVHRRLNLSAHVAASNFCETQVARCAVSSLATLSKMRLPSLDVLRGLTIAAMVVFHYSLLYFSAATNDYIRVVFSLGSYVGPMFFYLSGAGAWFFLQRNPPIQLFKRGIFLFVLTLLIGIFVKGRWYVDWSLIQDVGFAFIVIAVIARITRHRFAAALWLYLVCYAVYCPFAIPVTGEFPFFPWSLYFLIGYGFAQVCPTRRTEPLNWRATLPALLLCAMMFGAGQFSDAVTQLSGYPFFADAFARSGWLMALYFVFVYVVGNWDFAGPLGSAFVLIGRVSLTAYYIQQILLRVLQRIHFQVVVISPEISHFILMSLVLTLIYAITQIWQRFNFIGSLEWWMRRL